MIIVKQKSKFLVLQNSKNLQSSRLILVVILGLFFLIIAPPLLIFLAFNSSGTELEHLAFNSSGIEELACQRVEPNQVDCELTQSRYIGFKKGQKTSLSKVREARVDEVNDSEGDKSYKIYLLTQFSEVVLYNNKPADASRINDFVKNPESTSLTIKYDNRWKSFIGITNLLFLMIIGCFLIGLFVYEATTVETYTFDKTVGTLTKKRKILLRTQTHEYLLREIIDVRVENKIDSDEGFIGYKISLILTGDQHITFPSLFSRTQEEEARKLANTIVQFLNLHEPNNWDLFWNNNNYTDKNDVNF